VSPTHALPLLVPLLVPCSWLAEPLLSDFAHSIGPGPSEIAHPVSRSVQNPYNPNTCDESGLFVRRRRRVRRHRETEVSGSVDQTVEEWGALLAERVGSTVGVRSCLPVDSCHRAADRHRCPGR
jgi:hypothetical protein